MNFLFDIIKGMLIGVANIIPGVSGGTMMVSMGVYEKIIGVVNNLFKDIKKSILTLLPLGIGMVLGVPLGYAFAQTLTMILTLPSMYLAVSLHPVSYLIAGGLTLGFALLVNRITDRSLDDINPVEALKSVE